MVREVLQGKLGIHDSEILTIILLLLSSFVSKKRIFNVEKFLMISVFEL